ncbi:Glu/Leu/Phe/Val family dehydrogenase [Hyphococcus luteus]|uniref:Amino acid dehydrogenase n=1 Tax=Hyphococcus luteus TaxID=2058213 RepID=A0A2S7K1S1_9PROT|nr:Glu/Leu/Phe/Val dehydrogenase dimerization domain-containing protein [Marinicaulis flavus]PQA86378.1 amino acid dehydrogenase [Marinicaulis flavus]
MGVWQSEEFDKHEQVCFFSDEATNLRAIVAIHSTTRGPAAGGTRFKSYASDDMALDDALRLSRAMSYKSALAGLPVGGGKAVIIGDPRELKSRELLLAFGRFIDRIGNVFATGEDVGFSVADVETMFEVTPYVGGMSKGAGDPSIHTATGVLHGLRAVAEFRLGRKSFEGVKVAVQGLGSVGWRVARQLHEAGAELIVADIDPEKVTKAQNDFHALTMETDEIHAAQADIFCPCALGGVITMTTAPQIRAHAVAGAANNQLASPEAGAMLAQRNILFAPDYVINAGGVISGVEAMQNMPGRKKIDMAPLEDLLESIYGRLLEIFVRSEKENRTPEAIAQMIAQELIREQPLEEYA